MHEFVSDAGIQSERQSGFRKRHSTGTCLVEFLDVTYNIDNGRLSGVLFLDLKKAFDTVDHEITLNILMKMGMSDEVVLWFCSYLTDWSQLT